MTTKLPLDINDHAIPALRLKKESAHTISVSAISTRNTTPFNAETRIISIYATVPVFINFGDENVTAGTADHYFPAGIYYDIAIGGDGTGHYTHMAVLRAGPDGTVYVSEKE